MKQPTWITTALSMIGVAEIPGPRHSNIIAGWLDKLGAWWRDDETPWCGVFVAEVFRLDGKPYPAMYMRAKAWLDWGKRIHHPVFGCVVIFDRKGGGHVGFVIGKDDHNNLLVLGGNQGNRVSIATFPRRRVLGYRIPADMDYRTALALPVSLAARDGLSVNEA